MNSEEFRVLRWNFKGVFSQGILGELFTSLLSLVFDLDFLFLG